MDAKPPAQLGKYRLIIELAEGGMGRVYLAVAQGPAGFSKLSVIKELKPALMEEPGFLEMFLDEARLSARLNHPNVVQTNEVSFEGGRAWLAMEYLDGQSLVRLRARLSRLDKLPTATHLRIIAEACHGLHYAHELRDFDGRPLNVVHRDVSPHNVFVTYDGHVKIVDFGVAKALSSTHDTTTGVMKGKAPYMGPEQVRGEHMDRRLDVFAVGVMIWEAVAGKRMWEQMPTQVIIARLMTGEIPRLADHAPNASPRMIALVDRAIAFDREARFPTMDALRLELEACIDEMGGGGRESLRELGRAMAEAFAPERQQVNDAIQVQLRTVEEARSSQHITLVTIPTAQPTGSFGAIEASPKVPSGSAPLPLLPSIATAAEKQGGTGRTAASMALSHPPPPVPAKSRSGILLVLATTGFFVLAFGAFVIHRLASPPATGPTLASSTAVADAGVVTPVASVTTPPTVAVTTPPRPSAEPTTRATADASAKPVGTGRWVPAGKQPSGKKPPGGGGGDDDLVGY